MKMCKTCVHFEPCDDIDKGMLTDGICRVPVDVKSFPSWLQPVVEDALKDVQNWMYEDQGDDCPNWRDK